MKKCLFSFTAGVVFGTSVLFYFAEKGRRAREEKDAMRKHASTPVEDEDELYGYNADDELTDW